jgi:hypothetical protein
MLVPPSPPEPRQNKPLFFIQEGRKNVKKRGREGRRKERT